MKKYLLLGTLIAIIPNYVFGESAEYRRLVNEKNQKIEELNKCTGDVNGWKIAGISTIGLTAVGVAGNVALANKQSSLDKEIARTDTKITNTRSDIDRQNAEIVARNQRRLDCQNSGGTWNSADNTCVATKTLETSVAQQSGQVAPVASGTEPSVPVAPAVSGTESPVQPVYVPGSPAQAGTETPAAEQSGQTTPAVSGTEQPEQTTPAVSGTEQPEQATSGEQEGNKTAGSQSVPMPASSGQPEQATSGEQEGNKTAGSQNVPAPSRPNVKGESCTVGYMQNQKYQEGTYKLDCAAQTGERYLENRICDCTCVNAKWNCKEIQQPKKNNTSKIDINKNGTNKTYDADTGDWTVVFDYGVVKGTSKCSISEKGVGMPSSKKGENCWCMVKSLPTQTGIYPWVWYKYEDGCQYNGRCASKCAEAVRYYPILRQDMFGIY